MSDLHELIEKAFTVPVEFRPRGWREAEPAFRLPNAEEAKARVLSALQAAPVQQQTWRPTHRHVKTGGEYMLLGIGKMQAGKWKTPTIRPDDCGQKRWVHVSIDMREVAIYRGADGSLWARPVEEFNDGRFAPLPTNSEASSNG